MYQLVFSGNLTWQFLDLFVDSFIRLFSFKFAHFCHSTKGVCVSIIIMFTMQSSFFSRSSLVNTGIRWYAWGLTVFLRAAQQWLLLSNIIEKHQCILCMPRFYRAHPSATIATLEFRRKNTKEWIKFLLIFFDQTLHLFFLHKRKRKWK